MIELENDDAAEVVVSNRNAGTWLGIGAGLLVVILVAAGLSLSGSDADDATPTTIAPATTGPASAGSSSDDGESTPRTVAAGRVPPVDATVVAVDRSGRLVLIDVESDVVTRNDLDVELDGIDSVIPFGDGYALVDTTRAIVLDDDFALVGTRSGRVVAADETTMWAISTDPDSLTVHRAGEPSRTLPGSVFTPSSAGVDSGTLYLAGPTGVLRASPDGEVTSVDEVVHRRRGPVRLVTTCEVFECRLELRHDDGRVLPIPDDSTPDEIAMSWDGRLIAGGPPREGWIMSSVSGVVGSLIRPIGELSFGFGSDLLIVSEDRLVRLLDTTGLPEGSIGLAWQVRLPDDVEPGAFLVVSENP